MATGMQTVIYPVKELDSAKKVYTICRKYPSIFRQYFKVDPKQVTLEQARELAARYPVFRVETVGVEGVRGEGTLTSRPPMRVAS
jgi:hypothetical protein